MSENEASWTYIEPLGTLTLAFAGLGFTPHSAGGSGHFTATRFGWGCGCGVHEVPPASSSPPRSSSLLVLATLSDISIGAGAGCGEAVYGSTLDTSSGALPT